MKNFLSKHEKIGKFALVGLTGAALDFGILALLVEFGHWPVLVANIVSFAAALVNNYFLNKYWTWNDKSRNHHRQFPKFLATSLAGLLINEILMALFLWLGLNYLLAKVIICALVAFWNYLINNFWTFKPEKEII